MKVIDRFIIPEPPTDNPCASPPENLRPSVFEIVIALSFGSSEKELLVSQVKLENIKEPEDNVPSDISVLDRSKSQTAITVSCDLADNDAKNKITNNFFIVFKI